MNHHPQDPGRVNNAERIDSAQQFGGRPGAHRDQPSGKGTVIVSQSLADFGDQAGSALPPEVDLFDVLAARVRAGKAVHVSGPLDGPVGRVHLATINRLRSETGLPVRVIFS